MKKIAIFILFSAMHIATSASSEHLNIEIFSDPIPGWSKDRLVGRLLKDNSGFVISDKSPQTGPFDDAETFKVDSPLKLPYGNKTISIDVSVGSDIEPLWGNRLIQFQINGKEVPAAKLDSGEDQFAKEYGDDSKGFIPAVSGTYLFEIDKTLTDLQFISFMTAGASNFEMTINNIVIEVWAEEDVRPRPYLIHFNRLGYLVDEKQPVIIEWQPDLVANELPMTIRQANNDTKELALKRGEVFSGSGLDLTAISMSLTVPDYTTLIIPQSVKRTKHTTALFRTRNNLSEYSKARDEALGAFHWFDMETYQGAHVQDKSASVYGTKEKKDVYGGWYDAGDYGRYSVNGAFSVYMILLSYIADESAFPDSISPMNKSLDNRVDILSLVLPELLFLEKMQRDDGAVYHKVSGRDWPSLTVSPLDDKDEKFIMPISTTATADVSSVMNLAAFIFAQSTLEEDKVLAKRFKIVADKSAVFLSKNPDRIMIDDRYDGVEYGGPYTDENDSDERLLTAVSKSWLTGELDQDVKAALLEKAKMPRLGDPSPDWMNVNFLAIFSALLQDSTDVEFQKNLKSIVIAEFNDVIKKQADNPYGIAYAGRDDAFDWGSNGIIATVGSELLWLQKITGDQAFWRAAYDMSHWFFGLNPHSKIFTTGSTRYHVKQPHFRPLVSQAVSRTKGILTGGPNSVELKGDVAAAPLFSLAPMQVYIDHQDSWATNEVAINWQAAWASYLALLSSR